MKKRIVSIVLACCMLCFGALALSACGGGSSSSSSSAASDNAPADSVFIVGFDQSYPPYGYKDTETGEFTGLDLDLAEEVCKRNGWTSRLTGMPRTRSLTRETSPASGTALPTRVARTITLSPICT